MYSEAKCLFSLQGIRHIIGIYRFWVWEVLANNKNVIFDFFFVSCYSLGQSADRILVHEGGHHHGCLSRVPFFVSRNIQRGVRIRIMIKINGQEFDYQEKGLLEFLKEQGHRPEMVAVELNEEMVPREKFPETVFKAGDVVEIVMFMGGGAR